MSEIRSRIPTDQYRAEWERIFGKKEKPHRGLELHFRQAAYGGAPVDPDDHPKAD